MMYEGHRSGVWCHESGVRPKREYALRNKNRENNPSWETLMVNGSWQLMVNGS